jgi:hypothetical protein
MTDDETKKVEQPDPNNIVEVDTVVFEDGTVFHLVYDEIDGYQTYVTKPNPDPERWKEVKAKIEEVWGPAGSRMAN